MKNHPLSMPVLVAVVLAIVTGIWVPTSHADDLQCKMTLNNVEYSDKDCDNVPDKWDPCPKKDKKVEDGIKALDTDSDGVSDACDNCIEVKNPAIWSSKLGKSSQLDSDEDGIGDACDNCPKISNPDQTDSNNSGIGDVCECSPEEESNPLVGGPKDSCLDNTTLQEYGCTGGFLMKYPKSCLFYGSESICGKDKNGFALCIPKGPQGTSQPPQKPECGYYDTDKDGLGDDCDNCPFMKNSDQKDSDGNGIGDACEPKGGTGGGSSGKLPGSKGGSPDDPDFPKCKESPTDSHSSTPVASVSTANFYAVARVATDGVSLPIYIVAGEGGNVLWRNPKKFVWAAFHNPWDDNPKLKLSTTANYKRHITALWSSESAVIATTAGGYVFRTFIDKSKPENSVWEFLGLSGAGDTKPVAAELYAVHGTSPDDFWVAGNGGAILHYIDGVWGTIKQELILQSVPFLGRMDLARRGEKLADRPEPKVDMRKLAGTTWRGIQALSDGRVWVAGDGGRVFLRTADGNWHDLSLADKTNLRAVWADQKELYIGGANGRLYCNPKSISICTQLEPAMTILALSGETSDKLVAVGTHGVVAARTGSGPKDWSIQKIPVPNSLTSIHSISGEGIITGINGMFYDLIKNAVQPHMVLRKELKHPEWTETLWSAMSGAIDKNGNIIDRLILTGDDLAIVSLDASEAPWNWELVHSDHEFVPFTSQPKRNLKDLTHIDHDLYAVGNVDFLIKGDLLTPWSHIPFTAKSKPGPIPDMRSVRPGPNDTLLAAGTLGVFQYDPATGAMTMLEPASFQGAVALSVDDNAIWAMSDGLHGGITAPFNPPLKLAPEDLGNVGKTIAVIGKRATTPVPSFKGMAFSPFITPEIALPSTWHYLLYSGGNWQDLSGLIPSMTGLKRLKGFKATTYIIPKNPLSIEGMVILGEHELVEIETSGGVYQLSLEMTSPDAWMDGAYNYNSWTDIGLTEGTAHLRVDVLGVGSYNRIDHFLYQNKCTISYADVVKNFFGF